MCFNVSQCILLLYRLQELSPSSTDENPDYSDIELIQHINVDVHRLIKLLNGNKTVLLCIYMLLCSLWYIKSIFYLLARLSLPSIPHFIISAVSHTLHNTQLFVPHRNNTEVSVPAEKCSDSADELPGEGDMELDGHISQWICWSPGEWLVSYLRHLNILFILWLIKD